MKKILPILCICICIVGISACSKSSKSMNGSSWQEEKENTDEKDLDTEEKEETNANSSTLALNDTTRELATKDNLELRYGVFYDVYDGNESDENNILILQVLLSEAQEKEVVLEQNFLNVEDLIKNQNCSAYDQIEYIAKVKNKENKMENVISFLMDKNCINQISTAAITVEEYEQNVKDLWVAELPIETLYENESMSEAAQDTNMTSVSTENNTTTSTTSTINQENDSDIPSQTVTTSTVIPSTTSTSIANSIDEQNSPMEDTIPDFID